MNEVRQHVEELLRTLKLRAVLAVYGEITENAAKNNLQYEEYLVPLLEEEVKRRQEASIKAKVAKAKFPFIKTMEEFDFSFQPGLKERKVINLASLQFIEKQENIIFLGPPGVGKTHLSVGIGIKACMARYRVLFTSTQKPSRSSSLHRKTEASWRSSSSTRGSISSSSTNWATCLSAVSRRTFSSSSSPYGTERVYHPYEQLRL